MRTSTTQLSTIFCLLWILIIMTILDWIYVITSYGFVYIWYEHPQIPNKQFMYYHTLPWIYLLGISFGIIHYLSTDDNNRVFVTSVCVLGVFVGITVFVMNIRNTRQTIIVGSIIKPTMSSCKKNDKLVCVITGANTGIGKETARLLIPYCSRLYLLCRNVEKGNIAVRDIIMSSEQTQKKNDTKNTPTMNQKNDTTTDSCCCEITVIECDLCNYDNIRNCVNELLTRHTKIDILINNAGMMLNKLTYCDNQQEMCLQANYLGHFLLTALLVPYMSKSSKIINLTSSTYELADTTKFDLMLLQSSSSSDTKNKDANNTATKTTSGTTDASTTTTAENDTNNNKTEQQQKKKKKKNAIKGSSSTTTAPEEEEDENDGNEKDGTVGNDEIFTDAMHCRCSKYKSTYSLFGQYALSKYCNILHTLALANKFHDVVWTASIHPGLVRTDVTRNMPWYLKIPNRIFGVFVGMLQKTPEQGAYGTVFAAALNENNNSGLYYINQKPQKEIRNINQDWILKLWDWSCEQVGLTEQEREALERLVVVPSEVIKRQQQSSNCAAPTTKEETNDFVAEEYGTFEDPSSSEGKEVSIKENSSRLFDEIIFRK